MRKIQTSIQEKSKDEFSSFFLWYNRFIDNMKGVIVINFVKPTIFISACIEQVACRFDGTVISDVFVKRLLPYVNVVKVCPEMAIGMPSPRDSVRVIYSKENGRQLINKKR